jgi:hypothetical protein
MSKVVITPEFIDREAPPVMPALLHPIMKHADIVERDHHGRPVPRFAYPPRLSDKLPSFNASHKNLEAEPL